jgi:uncharacterized repeat protein (TIGR04052 family)
MKTTRDLVLIALGAALLASGIASCGDDAETGGSGGGAGATTTTSGDGATTTTSGAGGADTQDVTIAFAANVGDQAFSCDGAFDGLGASATTVTITDFRFYVHGVELRDAASGDWVAVALTQDGLWQHQDVALLDFEDKTGNCGNGTTETNARVVGQVPAGSYDGLRFKLGLPFELNHGDAATAPSPLNLTGLFWNWQGGYKFLRVDSLPVGADSPFNLHLGSTGCDGDPSTGAVVSCSRPNVTSIELAPFDLAASVAVADYAAVIAENDLSTDQGGGPGCMSGQTDPECEPVFRHLGLDVADGSLTPETQDFFRVE